MDSAIRTDANKHTVLYICIYMGTVTGPHPGPHIGTLMDTKAHTQTHCHKVLITMSGKTTLNPELFILAHMLNRPLPFFLPAC